MGEKRRQEGGKKKKNSLHTPNTKENGAFNLDGSGRQKRGHSIQKKENGEWETKRKVNRIEERGVILRTPQPKAGAQGTHTFVLAGRCVPGARRKTH